MYSKSEYTTKIGQCVRPSVRLSDNSSQFHPIELKFCTQNCLINISVEFEDENDPSRNGWVIEKIVIIDRTIPEGEYRDFFKNKCFLRIIRKIYKSTQFLTLIPNLILVLNQIVAFWRNIAWTWSQMHKNCIQKPDCLSMSQMTSSFGVYQMPGFVASFMVVLTYCGDRRGIILRSLNLLLGEQP